MTLASLRTVVVFAPEQLIDHNRGEFKAFLIRLASDKCNVIVDFRDTLYMDSSGLGVLVSLARHFQRDGLGYVACSLNNDMTELFALTRMDAAFRSALTIEEALQLVLLPAPPIPRPDDDDEPPPKLTLHR